MEKGKRYLFVENGVVSDGTVVETAAEGQYVRLTDSNGQSRWVHVTAKPVCELPLLKKPLVALEAKAAGGPSPQPSPRGEGDGKADANQ